ncbi:Uncharacterised protein [Sphingomonas paucimobilis]|nr:Uncharacterised protein [Sphingomonas paucimobilis]
MGASESGGGRESASDIRAELWARIAALDVSVPYAAATDLAGRWRRFAGSPMPMA